MAETTPVKIDPNNRTPEQEAEFQHLWKQYWRLTSSAKRAQLLAENADAMRQPFPTTPET